MWLPLLPLLALASQLLAAAAADGGASAVRDCTPVGARTMQVFNCVWSRANVVCEDFPAMYRAGRGAATLRLAGTASSRDLATRRGHCLQLHRFSRQTDHSCNEDLTFRNFTVGSVQFAAGTPKEGCRSCLQEVRILANVAALKQFKYRSSEDQFWDLRDSVFSAEAGSLVGMRFFAPYGKKVSCRISLANIQYLGNTSVESFSLISNANSSTDLKLGLMPKMQSFRIMKSYIGKFPEDADVKMPLLELLSLRHVGLEAVPAAVAGMRRLGVLELSGARLGRLTGQLPPLPSLTELALDAAGVCCVGEDPRVFSGLPRLEFLDISGNALTTLGSALAPLHSLQFLVASNNSLTDYPQLDIRQTATLVFDHNRLRTLPDCSHLSRNDSVLDLSITNNQITSWDHHPDRLRCVAKLNVSYNAVRELNSSALRALDALQEVDLGGNPLRCRGCALWELQRWLLQTAVRVRAAGGGAAAAQLRCAAPPALAGLPVGAAPSSPADCAGPGGAQQGALSLSLSLPLGLGLGLAAAAALFAAGAAACYCYRFELAYAAHLLRLRLRARTAHRTGRGAAGAPFEYDAFILYSGGDREWVFETLVPLLEKGPQRYRVCLHERDFQLGTVIVQNISRSMELSRHTVVVLSKNFVSSKWCMWEMDLANHRTLDPAQREFVIVLELEPLERSLLPRHVRFLLDTRTCLQWHQAAGGGHEQALRALKRALGGPCLPPTTETTRC